MLVLSLSVEQKGVSVLGPLSRPLNSANVLRFRKVYIKKENCFAEDSGVSRLLIPPRGRAFIGGFMYNDDTVGLLNER